MVEIVKNIMLKKKYEKKVLVEPQKHKYLKWNVMREKKVRRQAVNKVVDDYERRENQKRWMEISDARETGLL